MVDEHYNPLPSSTPANAVDWQNYANGKFSERNDDFKKLKVVNGDWYALIKISLIILAVGFAVLLYLINNGNFKTEISCPSDNITIPPCPVCPTPSCSCPACTNTCTFPSELNLHLNETG